MLPLQKQKLRAEALQAALIEIKQQRDRWQERAAQLEAENETLSGMVRTMAKQLEEHTCQS